MKAQLLSAVLLFGTPGIALADDSFSLPGAMPATFNWTGGYLGAQIGYGWGTANYEFGGPSLYDYRHKPDGFLGGIYTGYNYQFVNGVVVGAEADFAWSSLKDSSFAPGNTDFFATTTIDWTAAVRGRLGYSMDRILPYATAGVAFGRLKFDEFVFGTPWGSGKANLVGWTVGAGIDYAVTDNWVVRGEYRFTKFNSKSFVTDTLETFEVRSRVHDLRLGVAYKF